MPSSTRTLTSDAYGDWKGFHPDKLWTLMQTILSVLAADEPVQSVQYVYRESGTVTEKTRALAELGWTHGFRADKSWSIVFKVKFLSSSVYQNVDVFAGGVYPGSVNIYISFVYRQAARYRLELE